MTQHARRTKRMVAEWRQSKDCVIYARLSTGERKNTRQKSIPDQIKLATAAAEKLGYRVVAIYQDGRSRGVRRADLVRLLTDVHEMVNVGAVFIWQDTRLWGHQEQQRFLLYKFRLAGVRVFDSYCVEWKDETPMDKLKNMFSAGLSEYETGMTAVRIYELFHGRAQGDEATGIGEILQRPPYGLKVLKRFEGEQIVSQWVVDEDAMRIVRRIFSEYANGVPTYAIARALAAEGIPTPRGLTNWSPTNIRRTLDNKFYIGTLVWNRTKTEWEIDQVTGDKLKRVAHRRESDFVTAASPLGVVLAESLTDPESAKAAIDLFDRCQERRATVGREREPRKYGHRPLDGLVICGRCESRMQARRFGHKLASGKQNPNFDYRCPHRANFGTRCSKSHTMAENKIFRIIRAELDLAAAGAPSGLVQVVPFQPEAHDLRGLEQAVAAAKAREQRAHEAYEAGAYGVDVLKERLASAKADIAAAEADLAAAMQSAVTPAPVLSSDRLRELRDLLDLLVDGTIDIDLRRRAAANLIRQVRVDSPRIEIRLNVAA